MNEWKVVETVFSEKNNDFVLWNPFPRSAVEKAQILMTFYEKNSITDWSHINDLRFKQNIKIQVNLVK